MNNLLLLKHFWRCFSPKGHSKWHGSDCKGKKESVLVALATWPQNALRCMSNLADIPVLPHCVCVCSNKTTAAWLDMHLGEHKCAKTIWMSAWIHIQVCIPKHMLNWFMASKWGQVAFFFFFGQHWCLHIGNLIGSIALWYRCIYQFARTLKKSSQVRKWLNSEGYEATIAVSRQEKRVKESEEV